jgi:hypothetical protein
MSFQVPPSALTNAARRIEIPGDILIPDPDFCIEVLGGVTPRTARRLEAEGLPFVLIGGRKYRPVNEGRLWLATRIKRKQPRQQRRGR